MGMVLLFPATTTTDAQDDHTTITGYNGGLTIETPAGWVKTDQFAPFGSYYVADSEQTLAGILAGTFEYEGYPTTGQYVQIGVSTISDEERVELAEAQDEDETYPLTVDGNSGYATEDEDTYRGWWYEYDADIFLTGDLLLSVGINDLAGDNHFESFTAIVESITIDVPTIRAFLGIDDNNAPLNQNLSDFELRQTVSLYDGVVTFDLPDGWIYLSFEIFESLYITFVDSTATAVANEDRFADGIIGTIKLSDASNAPEDLRPLDLESAIEAPSDDFYEITINDEPAITVDPFIYVEDTPTINTEYRTGVSFLVDPSLLATLLLMRVNNDDFPMLVGIAESLTLDVEALRAELGLLPSDQAAIDFDTTSTAPVVQQFNFDDVLSTQAFGLGNIHFDPQWSRDGSAFTVVSEDVVWVFRPAIDLEPRPFFMPRMVPGNASLNADGSLVAIVDNYRYRAQRLLINIVDVDTGDTVQQLTIPEEGQREFVWRMMFSPDSSKLVITTENNQIFEWDVATGELLNHIVPNANARSMNLASIAYSDTHLAVHERDAYHVLVYDMQHAELIYEITTDGRSMGLFMDDQRLYLMQDTLSAHSIATGDLLWTADGETRADMHLDPTGILVVSQGEQWYRVDPTDGSQEPAMAKPYGVLNPNNQWVVDLDVNGDVLRLYNLTERQLVREWELLSLRDMLVVGGSRLAFATADTDGVIVMDTTEGRIVARVDARQSSFFETEILGLSPDGTTLAAFVTSLGSDSYNLLLYDIDGETQIHQIPLNGTGGIRDVVFSPDGSQVVVATGHWTASELTLIDAINGKEVTRVAVDASVHRIVWADDNIYAVQTNDDGERQVAKYDAATLIEVAAIVANLQRNVTYTGTNSYEFRISLNASIIIENGQIYANSGDAIFVLDADTLELQDSLKWEFETVTIFDAMDVRNGRAIVGVNQHEVILVDLETKQILARESIPVYDGRVLRWIDDNRFTVVSEGGWLRFYTWNIDENSQ